MTAPALPTEESFPVWTDLSDNWRAVDAHWIRDRLVHVFDDSGERNTVLGASARQGMLSYLKNGETPSSTTGSGLEFRSASGWETVRYPNLTVSSDASSITLRRIGAGSGIKLNLDGTIEAAGVTGGTGGFGVYLDVGGAFIKTGTRSVKLSTDTTQLLVDSPLKVTGDIESTAALKGASATLTGNLNAVNLTASSAVSGATAAFSGIATAGTFRAGDADITVDTALAVFRNRQSTANRLSFSATGAAVLTGSTVTINGAITASSAAIFQGDLMVKGAAVLNPTGVTQAPIAGVIAMNRAPTVSDVYPNGTIWFHI